MENNIGIMQGRLSPPLDNKIQAFPKNSWKNEFFLAEKNNFSVIEWVFDSYLENPILLENNILEIKNIIQKSGVNVHSVCADYFMQHNLVGISKNELQTNLEILEKLIHNCYKIGIDILEIPLVDESSIKKSNKKDELIENLKSIIPIIEDLGIWIAFETDLTPIDFKNFIEKFNSSQIRANYDIGNSTSLGYDPVKELDVLKDLIINVHVKDRKKNGNTVPLGTGDVNFDIFFKNLADIGYSGDLIIQGAREDLSEPRQDPILTCSNYKEFVKIYCDKYLMR